MNLLPPSEPLLPPLKEFTNAREAAACARADALALLNSQASLNPDHFQEVLRTLRRRQGDLEAETAAACRNQIENLGACRSLLAAAGENCERLAQQLGALHERVAQEEEERENLRLYERLATFKKNLGGFLDELKYFLDVNSQMKKLEALFDEEKYEEIFDKLAALVELRDNVLQRLQSGSEREDFDEIKREFEKLENFEKRYYDTLFGKVAACVALAKDQPKQLTQIVRVFERGDEWLVRRGKEPTMRRRAFEQIRTEICRKFDSAKYSERNVIVILEESKFIVEDLWSVIDHVARCFPRDYKIFEYFQDVYRENIERKILPVLDADINEKREYGSLIHLMNWIDQYQKVMKRAGVPEASYEFLRAKIGQLLPQFLDARHDDMRQDVERLVRADDERVSSLERIGALIKSGEAFEGIYPRDLFRYVNDQLAMIAEQLRGENLFKFFHYSICAPVSEALAQHAQRFVTGIVNSCLNYDATVEGESPQIYNSMMIAFNLKNFNLCQQLAVEMRNIFKEKIDDELHERIDNIVKKELLKPLKGSLEDFCRVFAFSALIWEVVPAVAPSLFRQSWLTEPLLGRAASTVEAYLDEIGEVLHGEDIYFGRLCRVSFQELLDLYFGQLLLLANAKVRLVHLKPTMLSQVQRYVPGNEQLFGEAVFAGGEQQQQKQKQKSKQPAKKSTDNFLTLPADRAAFVKAWQRDYADYLAVYEKRVEHFGSLAESLKHQPLQFLNLLQLPSSQLQTQVSSIARTYGEKGAVIVELACFIRSDLEESVKLGLIE